MTIGRRDRLRPAAPSPTAARDWITTLQPVVLEHWPRGRRASRDDALTTVGHWRGTARSSTAASTTARRPTRCARCSTCPRATGRRFALALGIHPDERADLAALARHGWDLARPGSGGGHARPPTARSCSGSWAELGLAKSGYVASRCGWFSDRSVCYLASGRPVVAQDTGFGDWLPTGEGLLAFSDADERSPRRSRRSRRDYDAPPPRRARARRGALRRRPRARTPAGAV